MAAAPAPFSRLQLAAALVEYDNDPTNPDIPYRSAHESAIFSHLRRHQDPRSTGATAAGQSEGRKSTDYLGVSVPSESGSLGGSGTRRSRSSINALRNPFGATDEDDEEEGENVGVDVEVDLTSWGLDALISKDKDKGKAKAKAKSEILPNPHPTVARDAKTIVDSHRSRGGRAMSVGALSDFGVGGAFLESEEQKGSGRSSVDLEHAEARRPEQRRRASTHALIEALPVTAPLHSVPFPSGSVRSLSPGPEEGLRPSSRSSRLDLQSNHARSYSNGNLELSEAPLGDSDPYGIGSSSRSRPQHRGRTTSVATMGSMNSRDLLAGEAEENPFAVKPPSPSRSSRFDPKARARVMSNATMGTIASRDLNEDSFAVRPPSPSRSSRFDPKVRDRTMSIASVGTRALLDNDVDGQSRFERPLTNVELLRPKVLVMPSPLQQVQPVAGPRPPSPPKARPGFQLSSSGPPIPTGAQTGKRSSTYMSTYASNQFVPAASNPFTPNPRAALTLSQLAFRNTLMVDGKRDVAYADIDRVLPRATEEGEQATFEYPEEEPEQEQEQEHEQEHEPHMSALEPEGVIRRPAGKLYGRSLIDNLEDRKTNMKSKTRAFTGDDRPSMMARGPLRRSETLIDPTSLGKLPSNANGMANNASLPNLHPGQGPAVRPYVSNNRSVFGADTVWQRELEKLKVIEAQEKLDAEEAERRAAEEADRKKKKKKKKSKAAEETTVLPVETTPTAPEETIAEPRVSEAPPVLPAISKPVLSRPSPVDTDDETASEASDDDATRERGAGERAAERWVANSSDEEDAAPRKTTGVGLRYPSNRKPAYPQPAADDDSEEDLPLAAAAQRVTQRATFHSAIAPDSDEEDKPLASVLDKVKLGLPKIDFDDLSHTKSADAEDDDKPLGLRMSHVPLSATVGAGDDDDRPLAFHPEQQRRTMFVQSQQQQQQQQQQIMMQQQWQNSVFFGGPQMMGSGFFAPPMAPPMMMAPPAPMPSPPPIQDPAKFGRVDKWRRDVAVEGSEV